MPLPRIFITYAIPQAGLDLLQNACDIEIWEEETPPSREALLNAVKNVEGIYSLLTSRIDAEIMDAAPKLKVISNMAVGYDNVDVTAASRRNIPVGNTPGVLTETSADLAFALLMAAARRLGEAERFVRAGKWKVWSPTLLLGTDIYGSTLGIIGFGRIGQAVARRAHAFGMKVLYSGGDDTAAQHIGAEKRSLDDLLSESDFVSLHMPYKPETHHFINAQTLSKMKPTGILINTARGGIVDQEALYEALKNHQIAYAALDVTDPEPLPVNNPLLTLENCIIVPHIGSASITTRNKMAVMAAENLIAGLKGDRLPNCVNTQVYGQ